MTMKHEAYSILFSMLYNEDQLVKRHSPGNELYGHRVDQTTAKGKVLTLAYRRALRRAAKPIANYLAEMGDDLGSPFPFDDPAGSEN